MAFCHNCGAQVNDGVKFCPGCGAPLQAAPAQQAPAAQPVQQQYQQPVQQQYQQPVQQQYQQPTQQYQQPAAVATDQPNKLMGILAYFGFLVLVPIFAAKDDQFARFHANQGLMIFAVEIVASILSSIAGAVAYDVPVLGTIISILSGIISLACFVFAIMGIVSAAKGTMKPLPLIGGIKILK